MDLWLPGHNTLEGVFCLCKQRPRVCRGKREASLKWQTQTALQPSPARARCLLGSWGMSRVLPAALGCTAQEEGGKSK